jgi:hypothetical protein
MYIDSFPIPGFRLQPSAKSGALCAYSLRRVNCNRAPEGQPNGSRGFQPTVKMPGATDVRSSSVLEWIPSSAEMRDQGNTQASRLRQGNYASAH